MADYNTFAGKNFTWIRFKNFPLNHGLVTEIHNKYIVAFNINYHFSDLEGFAEYSFDRIIWNEF